MDTLLTLLTLGVIRFVFVREGTNRIVVRFGRYRRTLTPGLQMFASLWGLLGVLHRFKITDVDTGAKTVTTEVDVREEVYDYPRERVISRDNVQFEVNAVIYFRVADPYQALFRVNDYPSAMRKLVQSILRSEIGRHDLEETYSNRTSISAALTLEADKATDAWGIKVIRLEIKEFELGKFADQLLRQKQQDIEKRQQILHAEGLREAKVKEAEGVRDYAVLTAEGRQRAAVADGEAIRTRAAAEAAARVMAFEAEAEGYRAIGKALRESPGIEYYLKLHTATEVSERLASGTATKLFLPASVEGIVANFVAAADAIRGESR